MAKTSAPAIGPYLAGPVMGVGNMPGSSQAGFPSPIGKTRTVQNLGNITGKRGAGMTRFGGSQLNHAFSHYGKGPDWKPDGPGNEGPDQGDAGGGMY